MKWHRHVDMAVKEVKYERTTQEQIFFYKEYCKTHPEVQGGYKGKVSPEIIQNSWESLAQLLNSLKGPVRTAGKWKETLSHWKNQINSRARKENPLESVKYLKDKYERLVKEQVRMKPYNIPNFTVTNSAELSDSEKKPSTTAATNVKNFTISRSSECEELAEKEILGLTPLDNEEETLDGIDVFQEAEVIADIKSNESITDEIDIKEGIIVEETISNHSNNTSLDEIKAKWTEVKLREEIQIMKAEHQLRMKILKEKHDLECKIAWEKHEMEKRLLFCRRNKSN